MMEFRTTAPSDHERDEELQWARILAKGNPVHGMILVFAQKLCTAFHELEPAATHNALKEDKLGFFRERLSKRTEKVLSVLSDHDLGSMPAAKEFRQILRSVAAASSITGLAALTEEVHQINHRLCDALEKRDHA